MAADQRQFTEHNEVGGANVYYEDKRMEELKSAAPKTDSQISTTDEYIPLQDTDGNLVKINPASFQEAVRNVLGGLLANNDKGVTISGIPALSGSGASLDFGSVTPANLASVLGVENLDSECASCIMKIKYYNTGFGMPSNMAALKIEEGIGVSSIFRLYQNYRTYRFEVWPLSGAQNIIIGQVDILGRSLLGAYQQIAPTSVSGDVCTYDNITLLPYCYAAFVCVVGECDGSKDVWIKVIGAS